MDVATTTFQAGIVLAGGGSDNDNAMRWMLERAGGGDVLVMRASGSDGYNSYFFSELGVAVNSVETIKFNSSQAANDPYVLRRIAEAELVFFAGGDQSDYVNYWRGTPVAAALNNLINSKGITVGGTSAGMAILGGSYYAPPGPSLISMEALSNPYHPNTVGVSSLPFLQLPFLANVITDTHFENRNRQGRTVTLLARATELNGQRSYAIAANDATAICVDELGIARVFGDFPNFDDYAFFMLPGCTDDDFGPETLTAGQPLTWNRGGNGLSVYRLPGTPGGTHTFDLSTFAGGAGGSWQNWFVNNGSLSIVEAGGAPVDCSPSAVSELQLAGISILPNPTRSRVELLGDLPPLHSIELFDLNGRSLQRTINAGIRRSLDLSHYPTGLYWLRVTSQTGAVRTWKVVRR